jgi:hypothetical protein
LLILLDELDELLEGLSNGLDFCTLGGMQILLSLIEYSKYDKVKIISANIVSVIT